MQQFLQNALNYYETRLKEVKEWKTAVEAAPASLQRDHLLRVANAETLLYEDEIATLKSLRK